MFPAMCRMPPCMNIDVKSVTHHGFWSIWKGPRSEVGCSRLRATASAKSLVPGQTTPASNSFGATSATAPTLQSPVLVCVMRYGIAP